MLTFISRSFWTLTGSPLLTGTANLPNPYADSPLFDISKKLNCTVPQAIYRFAQLGGITPLSGTTDEQHMKEDVGVDRINVSDEVKGLMDNLNEQYGIGLEYV